MWNLCGQKITFCQKVVIYNQKNESQVGNLFLTTRTTDKAKRLIYKISIKHS